MIVRRAVWHRCFVATIMVTIGLLAWLLTVGAAFGNVGVLTPHGYDSIEQPYPVVNDLSTVVVGTVSHSSHNSGKDDWSPRPATTPANVVAAKAGSGIVRYSPEAASRNLLGQLGEGFAVTPGGRTVSAHAAERIALGGPGRSPTTLARVDDILNNPNALRYDSVRDTVRVTQGKDFVVVRGSGPGQHIVTVMVR